MVTDQFSTKLTTEELAASCKTKPQTVLKNYCLHGHYQGLRPVKLPNRRLLWDAAEVQKLLNGGV